MFQLLLPNFKTATINRSCLLCVSQFLYESLLSFENSESTILYQESIKKLANGMVDSLAMPTSYSFGIRTKSGFLDMKPFLKIVSRFPLVGINASPSNKCQI